MKINKITEAKYTLQNAESVIGSMTEYIEHLRYLIYRYYLKHGEEIKGGGLRDLPDNINFVINVEPNRTICEIHDSEKIGMKNTHEYILEKLKEII